MQELFKLCAKEKIDLSVVDGNLELSFNEPPSDALVALLRARKPEVIEYINLQQQNCDNREPELKPRDQQNQIQLSFVQRGLWFIDQLEGVSSQYNIAFALQLDGKINEAAMQQTFDAIVERHEVLRTTYSACGENVVGVLNDSPQVVIGRHDLSGEKDPQQALKKLIFVNGGKDFVLSRDLMFRGDLIRMTDRQHIFLFCIHHIAADGWSAAILAREFGIYYKSFCLGQSAELAPLALQYADYAHWQREYLKGERLVQMQYFWQQKLADLPKLHRLPLDKPRPARMNFVGAAMCQVIDKNLLVALKALANAHKSTLFVLLQTAFAAFLGRWSKSSDIVIGSPVAGRHHPEVENLVGFFANTLVLRTRLDWQQTFIELLQANRNEVLEAFSHQHLPIDLLVDALKPQRSLSYTPLFQIMMTLHNNLQPEFDLPDLKVSYVAESHKVIKFDLQLSIHEGDDELSIEWIYATSLFEASSIKRFADSFTTLLQSIVEEPDSKVGDLPLQNTATSIAQLVPELSHSGRSLRTSTLIELDGIEVDLVQNEQILSTIPGVQRAMLFVSQGTELICYLVMHRSNHSYAEQLARVIDQCQKILPDYLMPTTFVLADDLPLSTADQDGRKILACQELYCAEHFGLNTPLVGMQLSLVDGTRKAINPAKHESILSVQLSQRVSNFAAAETHSAMDIYLAAFVWLIACHEQVQYSTIYTDTASLAIAGGLEACSNQRHLLLQSLAGLDSNALLSQVSHSSQQAWQQRFVPIIRVQQLLAKNGGTVEHGEHVPQFIYREKQSIENTDIGVIDDSCPLSLSVINTANKDIGTQLIWRYDTSLIKESTVRQLDQNYHHTLAWIIEEPELQQQQIQQRLTEQLRASVQGSKSKFGFNKFKKLVGG